MLKPGDKIVVISDSVQREGTIESIGYYILSGRYMFPPEAATSIGDFPPGEWVYVSFSGSLFSYPVPVSFIQESDA